METPISILDELAEELENEGKVIVVGMVTMAAFESRLAASQIKHTVQILDFAGSMKYEVRQLSTVEIQANLNRIIQIAIQKKITRFQRVGVVKFKSLVKAAAFTRELNRRQIQYIEACDGTSYIIKTVTKDEGVNTELIRKYILALGKARRIEKLQCQVSQIRSKIEKLNTKEYEVSTLDKVYVDYILDLEE